MNGILLIDKPSGWSSFDVVAKVRSIIKHATGLKKPKVGHTGTLDPLATGLMIVVVGDYCKRAQEFSNLDKMYEVTMKLGQTSTTGDEEGIKTAVAGPKSISLKEIAIILQQFVGDIMQVPPAFSAIKINGQRAYKLARAGQQVELEARPVHIESIRLETYEYPIVRFTAHVGSGTYIRSLVLDIGQKLQTGAYMTALRRTKVGEWNIVDAVQMGVLNPETIKNNLLEPIK